MGLHRRVPSSIVDRVSHENFISSRIDIPLLNKKERKRKRNEREEKERNKEKRKKKECKNKRTNQQDFHVAPFNDKTFTCTYLSTYHATFLSKFI